jgi:hypothetical protein
MKKTVAEKGAIREDKKGGTTRDQAATRLTALSTLTAALDRQVAEIERTFTLRYEW